MGFKLWKSKTFYGALLYAAYLLVSAEVIDAAVILEAVGVILAVVGIRHGIAKGVIS